MTARNGQGKQVEEEKYRHGDWQERMSQLPKNSAYRSSITFGSDGIYAKDESANNNYNNNTRN